MGEKLLFSLAAFRANVVFCAAPQLTERPEQASCEVLCCVNGQWSVNVIHIFIVVGYLADMLDLELRLTISLRCALSRAVQSSLSLCSLNGSKLYLTKNVYKLT